MDGNGNGDGKVVVNLATGLEDPERVTVAFLVAGAAAAAGKPGHDVLTKEAVRLALPGRRRRRLRRLPPVADARNPARRGRRTAARLPDLPQRPQARRGLPRRACAARRSNSALAMDR
jgi:hypothetical protein